MKKIDWNQKYTTIALYACGVIAVTVIALFLLLNPARVWGWLQTLAGILNPFVIGFVIAYLATPLMTLCEKKLLAPINRKKPHPRLTRTLAICVTMGAFLIILVLIVSLIVPQVVVSYNDFMTQAGNYMSTITGFVNRLNERFPELDLEKLLGYAQEFLSDTYTLAQSITPYITSFFTSLMAQLRDALLGVILAVYFLYSRELLVGQLKKLERALLSDRAARELNDFLHLTDETFGGYIRGVLLDSALVGLLTMLMMMIFGIPYYPLVGVIVGVTNVIPFFGPFIGAIPSAFIIFIASPVKCLWFVLIILIIQQIDGNIIVPKIQGHTTGLSSLGVIIAITVMGDLLGILGMFIGVPLFSLLYVLFKRFIEHRLRRRAEKSAVSAGEEESE